MSRLARKHEIHYANLTDLQLKYADVVGVAEDIVQREVTAADRSTATTATTPKCTRSMPSACVLTSPIPKPSRRTSCTAS